MRVTTFGLGLIAAAFLSTSSALAVPVTGNFTGTLDASDLATFSGDILGTPASDFHLGDAVSGTFTYDPALMTATPAPPHVMFFDGPVAYQFTIGSHAFSFAQQGSAVTLNPATLGVEGYRNFASLMVGFKSWSLGLDVPGPDPLYSDYLDLTSVQFQNRPAVFSFVFAEEDPISSELKILGAFEIHVLASLPVNPVPLPASLPLFAAALTWAGTLAWRRRRHAAA